MKGGGSLEPFAPRDVIWEGRPAVGVRWQDAAAGGTALVATFGVLAAGFHLHFGLPLGRALELAGVYGAIVGAVTTLTRAIGAGLHLSVVASLVVPVATATVIEEKSGFALACPLAWVGAVALLIGWRLRQRLGTRYLVTPERAALGERGRYTITFAIQTPPAVVPDRFGRDLGDVDFGKIEGVLTTRSGRSFRMPAQTRRFYRVAQPDRLRELIADRVPAAEARE